MNREQQIEWIVTRKKFYLCRGYSEDEAMLMAQIDAIEELGIYDKEDDHE